LDYAFGFFDAGRPFRTSPATPGIGMTSQDRFVDAQIGFRRLRYNPAARIRSDYGSRAFIVRFDAQAPRRSNRVPPPGSTLPYISFLYPALYYVVVATAMRITDVVAGGSLWSDLLAARFVGILLLALTLAVSTRIFRMSGFSKGQTLLALVCVGWFPLTSWVAGYVQPDNLSFALVTLVLWLGIRWQRSGRFRDALPLVLALAALFFTKQHYALGCWAAILLILIPRLFDKSVSQPVATTLTLLLVPAFCLKASFFATYSPGLSYASKSFAMVGTTMSPEHLGVVIGGFRDGIASAFFAGDSFGDYWLRFGERGETLFPARAGTVLRPVIEVAMLTCFFFGAANQLRLVGRIARVFRRRSRVRAVGLLTASLPLNVYCVTACIMIFAFVQSNELIWLEGRYWLPLIVPMILLAAKAGDGASAVGRRIVRFGVLGSLAGFCLVAALSGVGAIQREYYAAPLHPLRVDPIASILDVWVSGRLKPADGFVALHRGQALEVSGYAVDPYTGLAAGSVFAKIDDRGAAIPAVTGLLRPFVADAYSDDRIGNSGFDVRLPANTLGPGVHRIRLYVGYPGFAALPLRNALVLRVT
jgi:hypothetical protein